jgi:hypothetical protein
MRVSLPELMDKLAVGYVLSAYETCPWSVYDGEKGITCSAEVRMDGDSQEIEAELQMMYDIPPEGKPPVEQIFWMICKPVSPDLWETKDIKIRGTDEKAIFDWGTKGASFFVACVTELKMEKIPDIEALIDEEIRNKERYAGGRGGTSKAPKIKPQALLNMKQGRGF